RWDLTDEYLHGADEEGLLCSISESNASFDMDVAKILRAMRMKDQFSDGEKIALSKQALIAPLAAAGVDSYTRAYPFVVKLHVLQELEDFHYILNGESFLEKSCISEPEFLNVIENWEDRLRITQPSLRIREPLLAFQRLVFGANGLNSQVGNCGIQYVKLCRSAGHYEIANRAILEANASARQLMCYVARWWDLVVPDLNSYIVWLGWFNNICLSRSIKDILKGVCYVMWWVMWRYRNQILFGTNPPRLDLLFDEIVRLSYTWCSNRCNFKFDWVPCGIPHHSFTKVRVDIVDPKTEFRITKKINVHPNWKILQTLTNEAKLMMRVGPLVLSLDGKLLGPRRMTKKINVHPEWKILQTLTNGEKRKLDHLLLHLVNGLLWKTNDESGTPRSQSGWKTSWAKKDDKEDQCASQVVDSSNTNQWGKKEAGSSPFSSGKLWKTNDESGTPRSHLDGKLLGPRRMTKKINVHPEWKILQTLTNGAKRKLDHLLLHLVNGLLWKTNDESGTLSSRLRWKLLGPRRMTKKINVHPEWKILQTLTNVLWMGILDLF
ncbi:serine/threonine-protein kinase ATR, partial [Tanacetum coccineum]